MFNLTIKLRLIITMAIMAVMLTVGGAMGFYGVRDSNSAISELFTNQLPSVEAIGASRIALLRAITFLDRAIAHPADENAVENLKNINNLILKSDENWKKYVALPAALHDLERGID